MTSGRKKILSHFIDAHPKKIAAILSENNIEDIKFLIDHYEAKLVAKCLTCISPHILSEALVSIDEKKVAELAHLMEPYIVACIFRSWKKQELGEKIKSILSVMDDESVKNIRKLIDYSDSAIGSLMNSAPFTVPPDVTIKDVLFLLDRKKNRYSRYVYVVDSKLHLIGVLPFKDAFFANKTSLVSKIMTKDIFSFNPHQTIKEVIKNANWSTWDSVPVVDSNGVLLGVIRHDTIKSFLLPKLPKNEENKELLNAGKAVGEVFQIGFKATASALGLLGSEK